MPDFINPQIDLGHIITIIVLAGGWWITSFKRDQKIDLVLFGDEKSGISGMVHDVHELRDDTDHIYSHFSKLGPQFHLNRRSGQDRRN